MTLSVGGYSGSPYAAYFGNPEKKSCQRFTVVHMTRMATIKTKITKENYHTEID